MALRHLPDDFREFLKLLKDHRVEYLLIGGYAVAYHGYPRATADMDIWVNPTPPNADRLVAVLREFGFNVPELSEELFIPAGRIIRMGVPPLRLELWTSISGLLFTACYAAREIVVIDGIEVNLISLEHLKINKQATGRYKDLDDLSNLP